MEIIKLRALPLVGLVIMAITALMAQIPSGPAKGGSAPVPNFADAEVPQGSTSGMNAVFTLANAPNPPASLVVVSNGLVMKQGLDYTLAGKVVTFAANAVPQLSDVLLAWYRY